MTSEADAMKTNEFLRRRKLRLQQVREQSKEIAKKIRQRAKVEQLRHIGEVDKKKQTEYFDHQNKLIKKLEYYYANGVRSLGSGHKSASDVNLLEENSEVRFDLSKKRGKEAAVELRRKKQENLAEKKKLLDRKLQAREIANEISREKSTSVANRLLRKTSSKVTEKDKNPEEAPCNEGDQNLQTEKADPVTEKPSKETCEMATQWNFDEIPNEWDPHIPRLSLPKDDSVKETSIQNDNNRPEKSKRLNLFALSDEMPSSLRGGLPSVPEEPVTIRPSLTLVSEYLQNRGLRLRESDNAVSNIPAKKDIEDLQSIKQTILKTRASRTKVQTEADKSTRRSEPENGSFKKNLVTSYNHSTRDTKDTVRVDRQFVVRDQQMDDDAYSLAVKESSSEISKEREDHQKKLQIMRSKLAISKQNVEKEYRDTMQFLNSVPMNTSKPIKNAYKDDQRIQMHKDNRQRKMQSEFKKIEKDCRKQAHSTSKSPAHSKDHNHNHKYDSGDDCDPKDFQYSWMPVPDGDNNFAVHTIPTSFKPQKPGNNVKFRKVDSYHEYRSRHKHTPPTKEASDFESQSNRKSEANHAEQLFDKSSVSTESSFDECIPKENDSSSDTFTEIERIILSRILDSKLETKKRGSKESEMFLKHIMKSLSSTEKAKILKSYHDSRDKGLNNKSCNDASAVSLSDLNEGIYKAVSHKGATYTVDCVTTEVQTWNALTDQKTLWEKLASLNVLDNTDNQRVTTEETRTRSALTSDKNSTCNCRHKNKGTVAKSHDYNKPSTREENSVQEQGKCFCEPQEHRSEGAVKRTLSPSAVASTSSFKSALADKMSDNGFVKLLADSGTETAQFYIGASGLLQDHGYEVVIHLRKKNVDNEEKKEETPSPEKMHAKQDGSAQDNNESKEKKINNYKIVTSPVPLDIGTEVEDKYKHQCMTGETDKSQVEIITQTEQTINMKECGITAKKDATSTYTQTGPESPDHPKVYHRMSSSTSTAYMSPPEVILPPFLKQSFKSRFNANIERGVFGECCEKYPDCRCKHCLYVLQATKRSKLTSSPTNMNTMFENIKSKTPMNSYRSRSSSPEHSEPSTTERIVIGSTDKPILSRQNFTFGKNTNGPRNDHKHVVKKKKSRTCDHHSTSKTCTKVHSYKSRRNNGSQRLGSLNVLRLMTNRSCTAKKNINKFALNPLIKTYVDKLLALNKEGLKAVEVMNQECSSVTTPGSSIIEEPRNMNMQKSKVQHALSLEQLKDILQAKLVEKMFTQHEDAKSDSVMNKKKHLRRNKKKTVHKVKSFNVSKNLVKTKVVQNPPVLNTSVRKRNRKNTLSVNTPLGHVPISNTYSSYLKTVIDRANELSSGEGKTECYNKPRTYTHGNCKKSHSKHRPDSKENRIAESDYDSYTKLNDKPSIPLTTSTQTASLIDEEIKYMRIAEDKIQNMEKIADLTEKCTKRLSNLAKVLDKVRKNKFTCSHVSDSISEPEQSSGKKSSTFERLLTPPYDPIGTESKRLKTPENHHVTNPVTSSEKDNDTECTNGNMIQSTTEIDGLRLVQPEKLENQINGVIESEDTLNKNCMPFDDPFLLPSQISNLNQRSNVYILSSSSDESLGVRSPSRQIQIQELKDTGTSSSSDYLFLKDIPSPNTNSTHLSQSFTKITEKNPDQSQNTKHRTKPPPALSRINLKHKQDHLTPHELSTVIEVDSPLSLKPKTHTNNNSDTLAQEKESMDQDAREISPKDKTNPDIIESSVNVENSQPISALPHSPDDKKIQMMDLKQFNDIMLKPFISIQEYAKQCNLGPLDEGSNIEEIKKEPVIDDVSSLHSDASLPDVIAELLKRNLISEPFQFDTASNVNSTTISSESTLSVLALSKVRKRKSDIMFQNKENIAESSDSMSISSNPDLENAFKKLGMGWASSTLKKTKERQALSSSSNTSSSSLSQFKIKGIKNSEMLAMVSDYISSTVTSNDKKNEKNLPNSSKTVEQQTSNNLNTMTVKDFLTNELSKKITFTNKSRRGDTTDEFVSLYETKMPEEMKRTSQIIYEERSIDSTANGSANRARTSTPVQLYKSKTYHSSSSSNLSNGLFSNADELSSVKGTSNSQRNHSTSEKDDLTIPNCSLRKRKDLSDYSKSD